MNPGWDLRIRVLGSRSATRSGSPATRTARAATMTTVIVELRVDDRLPGARRPRRGLSRRLLRRDAGDDAGRPGRAPRGGRAAGDLRRRTSSRPRARRSRRSAAAIDRGDRQPRRRQVRPRHRPPRPRRARRSGCRSTELLGLVGRDPADRLHARASTSRPSSPSAPRRAGRFPALKIKVGGPADLETLEAVRAVYGGPIRVDANTGWTPEVGGAAPPGARPPRRRADRAAVPGPPATTGSLAPGALAAADRRRRERGHDRGPRRARRASSTGSTSSSPSAAASGPARADAGPGPGARLPDVPRLHGGDVASGSPPRRPSPRWPTGSTSTAACSSPTTRSTGLELGDDCRWRLADAPGLGVAARA